MAAYLSQKELIKSIETNLNNLESGQLSLSEIEDHLNLVRQLYERTIALRYKAFEQHSAVEIKQPKVEELAPVIEAQEAYKEEVHVDEIAPEITEEIAVEEPEKEEKETEIEFDFFSANEPVEEEIVNEKEPFVPSFSQEAAAEDYHKEEVFEPAQPEVWKTSNEPEEIIEEKEEIVEIETPAQTVEESRANNISSSGFAAHVFKIEQEIKNHIGFSSLPTLIGSFGLNERLLYINELFDGSSESFSDAVKHLDSRTNLSEAASFVEEIAVKFNWDIESDTVEEFIQKLCRRYA